jgi:iron complex outermembrane receptor protein
MQGLKTALDFSEKLDDYFEAYAFGTLAASRQHNDINWRNPSSTSSVYKKTAAFPGFDLNTVYPTGFTPDEGADALDSQSVVGIRHSGSDDFTWDFSTSYGVNNTSFFLNNSINASMGPDSPHNFQLGHRIESELDLNADGVYRLHLPFLVEPLNVAFGVEYRDEVFQMKAGDPASYEVGAGASYGLAAGANGFPGISDLQAGAWSQKSYGGYVDLQAQITKDLQLEVALRDESFSAFGNTFDYKFGTRYELTEGLALRGSYSTGFKAPTPAQLYSSSTSQGLDTTTLQLYTTGRLSNTVAQAFGGAALKPETSKTATLGTVWESSTGFTGSVDLFKTDVQKRFSNSDSHTVTASDIAKLESLGVPGASTFTSFYYFTNDFNTMTRGVEVTGKYATDLGSGRLGLSGAYSYTATKVTSGSLAAVSSTSTTKKTYEQGVPQHNASATVTYDIDAFTLMSRVRFYGPWTDSSGNSTGDIFQRFGSMAFVDVGVTYQFNDHIAVRLGAENVGNFYPAKATYQASRGIDYSRNAPYDTNGGNYYLRYDVKF